MRSYIKINSYIPAIIFGFLSFYVLFIRWDIPWEIGFIDIVSDFEKDG